ncbi:hypothetical protein QR680_012438 [Steinernema hermaphroditum]|uniref:Putative neurobeachin homolog n=1 Tax=Steinernema hermaphroditum TaxID=289476 RepID=A0AA39M0R3_9BILA|nr:hypothetical protein QR680_012438 [Steinernema hermaphroditum]
MSRSRESSETENVPDAAPAKDADAATSSASHPIDLEITVDVNEPALSPPPQPTPLKTPDIDDAEMEDVMLNEQAEAAANHQIDADSGACSEETDTETEKAEASKAAQLVPVEEKTVTESLEDAVPVQERKIENETESEPEPEATSTVRLEEVKRNESIDTLSNQMSRTTVIHSSEESPEDTFKRLTDGICDGSLTQKDVVDGVFNVLVGGPFDLESRFIMESAANINSMLYFLDRVSPTIQAEIWSVFVAIARKSNRNLEACSRVGLITKVLDRLPLADNVISDFLVQLLGVLSNYSITVKETKRFLRALEAVDGVWPRNSFKLLQVMKEMSKRDGADVFFSFPGKAGAGIVLPPLARWPYQNGWAFCTWLRMDPLNSVNFEKEKPFLFFFKTSKNMGYSCYFMGNCLVVSSVNNKGKEITRCIRQELTPRKWHHIAISYVYSRWSKSEIQCFIDGQLCETIEMPWVASTNDYFNKCFVGCGPENDQNEAFCGQMAAVYVFSQAITLQQANCLYCLGATYQSYFKHDAESNLPEGYKKHLFDGRLNNSLMIAYCPKNCHGSLCLYQVSQPNNNFFVQVPHAVMKEGVEVITTHSIHNSLHSVGGIQMLLPLFAQIDMAHADRTPSVDYDICSTLLSVISLLLNTSASAQQQLFHSRGFLIISSVLNKASKEHLTMRVLEAFIEMAKFLLTCPAGNPLLKQLFDHIFLNPQLWMRTLPEIQMRLYSYLANEFLVNTNFSTMVRRTATVSELIHAIKTAYWVVPPRSPSAYSVKGLDDPSRPSKEDIVKIRGHILALINRLMFMNVPSSTSAVSTDDGEFNRDEEFQLMLNFVGTVYEDDNLYDVLSLMMRSLYEHPAVVIPAFDRKKGISIVFKLLNSPNELIRIPALKLFGYFLCRSTLKRKNDSVTQLNLLSLLTDRLLTSTTHLSQATYNVLFEMLIERMTPDVCFDVPEYASTEGFRFENPVLLKVIANLIAQSEPHPEVQQVKTVFLQSIIRLCENSKENRRTILQMSVWQEWLINLSYGFPESEEESRIAELVYRMFGILLYHAIRLEYGGWRVWVDTLAIAHSKVSREKFDRSQRTGGCASTALENAGADGSPSKSEEKPSAIYRTPEFVWSKVHLRLLDDLLGSVEGVVDEWKKEDANNLMDHVNSSESHIFVQNAVHVLSQLIDSLIMACGGLLPLLAAATSPNSELEIVDSTQQELSIEDAVHFLTRFANLADVFIFISGLNFSELEQEKNMPNGGILRQSLRLVSTVAVRNILACRLKASENGDAPPVQINSRIAAIQRFVNGALDSIDKSKGEIDIHRLLQEADLQRLKGIVYRDMEENRQAQFLALAVTYLLSVLMVSRYRDILEPPTSPSPFFNTSNGSNCSPSQHSPSASVNSISAEPVSGSLDAESSETHSQEAGTDEHDAENVTNGATAAVEPGISSIRVADATGGASTSTAGEYRPDHLSRFNAGSDLAKPLDSVERRAYLTAKLQNALESVAPLLREIMCDFKSFLQKTLLGTHSQEIMNDVKVMQTLKNQQGSVIELVMLLCSQEWQTSLQKHAGLAFIELVNEGRLMAHATRDHVLRVANEAEFILNRLRAEDVTKHSQFESESAEQLFQRKRDEYNIDHLLTSSRRRDALIASKMLEKMKTMLIGPSGAWSGSIKADGEEGAQAFYKLDVWEDDSRRRKRFVPNPHGCRHSMAELNAAMTATTAEERQKARDDLLKELIDNKIINTFHLKTGSSLNELVDESDIDKWGEESDTEVERTSYSTSGRLIAPGIVVPGTISITSTDLYFDADEDDPLYQQQDPKCLRYCDNLHGRWHFQEIRAIFLRRYMLQNTALELFLSQRTAIMFAFNDQETVKRVVDHLPRVGVGVKYGLPQSRKTSLMSPRQLYKHSDMPQKWQKREISNFDYLMFLNTVAGRTFNDLNQYPIFPWVLSNYNSETLDLSQASNFRDLSKPIGALSESRRKVFQDRFNNWEHDTIPPFHYGTHYSTQAFTLNWLLRVEPFTTMFLHMQSGRFDHSDRLFHSMAEVWDNCQRDTQDVKELIPELFYMPELFRNDNCFELGVRDNGERVNDVLLPAWAKNPEHFVYLHRQALESDLVSCQLNQWIDLIFGYKQKGPEAVRAQNVFYYLTYEGAVNVNTIENSTIREGIEQQILSFGQTPVQLLTEPHLPRHSIMTMSPMMFQTCKDDLCMLMKFISNSAVVHISANTFPQLSNPTVLSVAQNLVFSLNRWNHNYSAINAASQSGSLSLSDKEGMTMCPPDLPLTVDPLLAVGNPSQPLPKRHLGDSFDQRLPISWNNFVATVDSQFIMACGYPDYSFRIIGTDNAQTKQVVYGHGDVVTCIARSEATLWADCYIASGSLDCTVVLWHWNSHTQCIAGEYNTPGETAAPRAILTGHDAQITAIGVSAELGIVVSGSQDGVVLIHTTNGDLLRSLPCEGLSSQLPVTNIVMSRECLLGVFYGKSHLATFTTSGRQLQTQPYRFQEPINCATLSRDGEYLIVGSANGRISVLRLFPHQVLYTFQQTDSAIRCVALSVNQRFVMAGLDSGAIVVFNIDFNRWHFEYKQRYLHNQRRL